MGIGGWVMPSRFICSLKVGKRVNVYASVDSSQLINFVWLFVIVSKYCLCIFFLQKRLICVHQPHATTAWAKFRDTFERTIFFFRFFKMYLQTSITFMRRKKKLVTHLHVWLLRWSIAHDISIKLCQIWVLMQLIYYYSKRAARSSCVSCRATINGAKYMIMENVSYRPAYKFILWPYLQPNFSFSEWIFGICERNAFRSLIRGYYVHTNCVCVSTRN